MVTLTSPMVLEGMVEIYSMRRLNQNTASVLEEINSRKGPGLITRRGRPIALILPLMDSDIETRALSVAVQEWLNEPGAEEGTSMSSEELAKQLGFDDSED